MTVCNMSIEAGARAGLVAPDDTTFAYLEGRRFAPSGAAWERALDDWRTLVTDDGAVVRQRGRHRRGRARARTSRGAPTPARSSPIDGAVPDPDSFVEPPTRESAARALAYMGLTAGTPMRDIAVDTVFIGSCTNSRIEDLRAAAAVLEGRQVAAGLRALVVPGSMAVKAQAEAEGLDRVFTAAGFEWREAGCSMCLAMNPDKLAPGERCASTSNRNFEGRQGRGGRTHLVSPAVAAATAVAGHFATPADLDAVLMDAVRVVTGHRGAARPLRRRHRPDHPERLAQAGRAHRASAPACSPSGATTATSCSTTSGTPAPSILRRRPELRHRLVARARGVGDHGLRLQGRRLQPVRRHLPQQLHEERLVPVAGARPTSPSNCWTR